MKKPHFSLILIGIIVFSMVIVTSVRFGNAQSGTSVSGIIGDSVTWTQADSPYNLTGNVLVYNGATLTIQAGTIVNLGSYFMEVNGTLQAIGSTDAPIKFNSNNEGYIIFDATSVGWSDSTATGCIIENSILNSPLKLVNSAKINHDTINDGINVQSSFAVIQTGTPVISNNFIGDGITLGSVRGNALILNNTIIGNSTNFGSGSGISWGGLNPPNATITGNTIIGCGAAINIGLLGSDNSMQSETLRFR